MSEGTENSTSADGKSFDVLIPFLFGITIFLSAALMFLVEPFVGRLLLPRFGGGPNVWNICVLFFQATLLCGYVYSHFVGTRLSATAQLAVQLVVVWLPLLFLPVRMPYSIDTSIHPLFLLFLVLLIMIGASFFSISTTAPLMQRWYWQSRATGSSDPYYMYAASNLGGVIGLLAYPILVEPNLTLHQQSECFGYAYLFFAALVSLSGVLFFLKAKATGSSTTREIEQQQTEESAGADTKDTLTLLLWAALPASLFLAVTAYVTSEVTSIAFFWMLPLLIYLLSFIIAFSRINAALVDFARMLVPPVVLIALIVLTLPYAARSLLGDYSLMAGIGIQLLALLVICTACHGAIAGKRPDARHLTGFFLTISVGGVLGSSFSTLLAPLMCKGGEEYPALAIASAIVIAKAPPFAFLSKRISTPKYSTTLFVLALMSVAMAVSWSCDSTFVHPNIPTNADDKFYLQITLLEILYRFIIPLAVGCFLIRSLLQYRLSMLVLAGFVLWAFDHPGDEIVYRNRDFFGRVAVILSKENNNVQLWNGAGSHGAESINPVKRGIPYFYCYLDGPIGKLKNLVCSKTTNDNAGFQRGSTTQVQSAKNPIAVMGLGAGMAAALADPGETMIYYEINPQVLQLADDPFYFTYLYLAKKRKVDLRLVQGDGRLEIQKAPYKFFRLIVSDCYNSNSYPVHMITKEALQAYLSKLTDNGALLFNITNVDFDFKPVLASAARELGLQILTIWEYDRTPEGRREELYIEWVMLTPDRSLAERLKQEGWKPILANDQFRTWTDDYYNPLSVLK